MLDVFVGAISVVLLLGGALCCYEYTFYTQEQKAVAPGLTSAYLGVSVLITLVGLAGLASAVAGSGTQTFFIVVVVTGAFPALIQHRLHRKLGIERSPLTEHAAENWR